MDVSRPSHINLLLHVINACNADPPTRNTMLIKMTLLKFKNNEEYTFCLTLVTQNGCELNIFILKSFKDCQKFKSYQDQTCKSSYTHVKVLNQTNIEVAKFLETEIFEINDPNICMGPKWTKPVDYNNLIQMQLFNCQPPCKGQKGPCIRYVV